MRLVSATRSRDVSGEGDQKCWNKAQGAAGVALEDSFLFLFLVARDDTALDVDLTRGILLLPRYPPHRQRKNPAGEWWELFDDVHNLPYYYNTKTGQTDWERPQDSTNIISLTAIQVRIILTRSATLFVGRF